MSQIIQLVLLKCNRFIAPRQGWLVGVGGILLLGLGLGCGLAPTPPFPSTESGGTPTQAQATLVAAPPTTTPTAAPTTVPPTATPTMVPPTTASTTAPPDHALATVIIEITGTASRTTGFAGELILIGIYEPDDPSTAAVRFRETLQQFEQSTNIKVNYQAKPTDQVDMIVQTYLAAGVPMDVGLLKPDEIDTLVKAGVLLQLDGIMPPQTWSRAGFVNDSHCVVNDRHYCIAGDQGLVWVVPKNVANPFGASRLLGLLSGEN